MNFTESDVEKMTRLLNMVAAKASFQLNTSEIIQYFGLLSWAQKELLPKLEANIFEIKEVKKASPRK